MNFTPIFACALAGAVIFYLAFCIFRMLKAPAMQEEMKAIGQDNTDAVRENNALLRELIGVNKQILKRLNELKS